MPWKKYFSSVTTDKQQASGTNTSGSSSPLSSSRTGTPNVGPASSNYNSYLPEVYTGSPNRHERYGHYDTMDQDSEVNAALDILAEFCTQTNPQNGTVFKIRFNKEATNSETTILGQYLKQWYKIQDFDTRMFRIMRNLFKYGDEIFVRDPETMKLYHSDPSNVQRVIVNESRGKIPEQYILTDINFNFRDMIATTPQNTQSDMFGGTDKGWLDRGGSSGNEPYGLTGGSSTQSSSVTSRFEVEQDETAVESQHVLHLSLSEGLDNNYPFGNSLLEDVFKVYKQKELLEDAIIIYRVQRAPERRVFYIDVGNMPTHLAMQFVERVKTEIHQRRIPSSDGGGKNVIDSSYNPLCLDLDTEIPLLDERTLTLNQVIQEFEDGKTNWVYSCNPETGEVVPGVVDWAGVTRENADVIELTFDNGETLVCTPDHKIPVFGKGFVQAKDIKETDSLIPFRKDFVKEIDQFNHKVIKVRKVNNRNTGTITVDGNEIYHNYHTFAINSGIFVKNSVNEDYFFPQTCLSLNTSIKLLDNRDLTLKEIINETKDGRRHYVYTIDPETHEVEPGEIVWADVTRKNAQVLKVVLDNNSEVICTPDHRFITNTGKEVEAQDLNENDKIMPSECESVFVKSIEWLEETIDTGDITVESENNNHNFALTSGIFVHNSEGRGSRVETLPGGTNLGEIDDLRYFTNKLVRGLRIPSSYLPTGPEDSTATFNDGRVGTAYIQELRFNKYCKRLQGLVVESFNREFKKYLLENGVNIDTNMFDLEFEEPQNFASYRQSELDNQRVPTYQQMAGMPHISQRFAMKRFLGLTEEEIAENEKLWREENDETMGAEESDSEAEMRSAGVSSSGIEADAEGMEDEAQGDEEGIDGGDEEGPGTSTDQDIGPQGGGGGGGGGAPNTGGDVV